MCLDDFFSDYLYPEEYIDELSKIAQHCETNRIELYFVILPTYSEVIQYLGQHDLESEFLRFKNDIKNLGKTFDFHVKCESTDNRSNFIDYFHLKPYYLDEITWKVWGEEKEKYRANTPNLNY
jgi:hypothetical protein